MSTNNSNLLIDEYPLQVLPTLAIKIGLNQAIVLQQIHFWLSTNRKNRNKGNFKDGHWWSYNSIPEWQQKDFPWWSVSTIQRILSDLEKNGYLITMQPGAGQWDHTKWYSIDYEKLNKLFQFDTTDDINLTASIMSNCDDQSCQSDTILIESETLTETTTETLTDSDEKKAFSSRLENPALPIAKNEESVNPSRQESIHLPGNSIWSILQPEHGIPKDGKGKALARSLQNAEEGMIDLNWIVDEQAHALMDVFVRESGIKPILTIKGQKSLWIKVSRDWLSYSLTPDDITGSVRKLRESNLSLSGPQSITNTAVAIHNTPGQPDRNNGHKTIIDPSTGMITGFRNPADKIDTSDVPGWNETYYETYEEGKDQK